MGDEFSRDGQEAAAAAAEKAKETAAKTPDTKAGIALVAVDVGRTQTLDLAGQLTQPPAPGKAADPAPAAATPETPAAPETPVEPEKGFFDSVSDWFSNLGTRMGTLTEDVSKHFDEEIKDKPDFLDKVGPFLSTGVFAVTDFFKKLFNMEDVKADAKPEEKPQVAGTTSPAFDVPVGTPQNKRLLAYAKKQIDDLRANAETKTWVDYAQELEASNNSKYGGVPASTVLAIAQHESEFDPTNRPKGPTPGTYLSSAEGLGQFINGTWASFQKDNPEFKDAVRTDPKASLAAIAWYVKENGRDCGVDATDPSLAGLVYEAHFAGGGGFKMIQAALRGEVISADKIPKTYRLISGADTTYLDYAHFATNLGAKVQSVANLYQAELSPAIA